MPLKTSAPGSGAPAPLVHLSSDFIRAKEYLEAIVTSTSDAICTTDVSGRIIYFSPGAEVMLGAASAQMMGRSVHTLYSGGRPEAERLMKALRKQGSLHNREMVFKAKGGRQVHVSLSASLLRDRRGRVIGTLGIAKDITARVRLEARLRELAITDNLTGLFNQRHFRERLSQEASRARRQRYRLSLVLIDLDGFKRVNDERGHLEGDRILRGFAQILRQSIRSEMDSAYRYGGDEFVVLLPGMSARQAGLVARRLSASAAKHFRGEGIAFSYGVAALPRAGGTAALLRQADQRMFRMKKSRKADRPSLP